MRQDDLLEFIADIENEKAARRQKVNQSWSGTVVIRLKGMPYVEVMKRLHAQTNKRWVISYIGHRESLWLMVAATYTAKGANADDAERMFAKLFDVEPDHVRVSTTNIAPVGDPLE